MKYLEFISSIFLLGIITYTIFLSIKHSKIIGIYNMFSVLAGLSLMQIFFAKLLTVSPKTEDPELANTFTITIYIILEFCIFIVYFYLESKSKLIKKICAGSIFLLLTLIILSIYFQNNIKSIQITSAFIESTILVVLSMLIFLEIIFDDTIISLFESPFFIITFSVFFFFGITYPFYALSFFIKYDHIVNLEFSLINNIAYIVFYFLIIKGIRCKILTTS